MIALVLVWCLAAMPGVCTEQPTGFQFPSGIACITAAQEIAAQNERPGYVLHFRCGPPEKKI